MSTMTEKKFDVRQLKELYNVDTDRIELAKKRQAAVFRHETPDHWPIILHGELTEEQKSVPAPDFKEAFYDKEMMLCGQMRAAMTSANSKSDIVPSIRGNFGCGTLCSCFGLEQEVYADKMPWMLEHLTRDQVANLTKDDIKVQGTFKRGLEYMQFYKEIMGDAIDIFVMDTQGPFDLAHLIMGDDLFLAIYDDPALVHHLLDLCVELGIRSIEMMKGISGEPMDKHVHGNQLYADNMGTRICEDTTVIVGPDIIDEFAMPYTARLAEHFGGAWIHYCGRNDHLTKEICKNPIFKGINFGHVPGNEHDQPFEENMQRCLETGTVYTGGWPKRAGESDKQYLQRLHKWASQGALIPHIWGRMNVLDEANTVETTLDYWYSL